MPIGIIATEAQSSQRPFGRTTFMVILLADKVKVAVEFEAEVTCGLYPFMSEVKAVASIWVITYA